MIYEIISSNKSFLDLDEIKDKEVIKKRYIDRRFSTVDDVLAGQIIYKC